MSGENDSESVLRRSLDAIDTLRRRVLWAGYVAVAGSLAAFAWLNYIAKTSTNLESLIMAAVLALTCVIAWSTFALAVFITRMTKRILRAIDLLANKS